MPGPDSALFELINAGASVPEWTIDFAIFASDALPGLLAVAIGIGAAFDRRWRYAFFTALVSVLAVWVIVNIFRGLLPFPRPAFYGLGIQWEQQGIRAGFPSMHSAGTFAAAFSLWSLPWRTPMRLALLLAAVVAWSRVYLGLHFPSDVLCGAMLAMVVSVLVERRFTRPVNRMIEARLRKRLRARMRRA